jgi:hypothetical protein
MTAIATLGFTPGSIANVVLLGFGAVGDIATWTPQSPVTTNWSAQNGVTTDWTNQNSQSTTWTAIPRVE